MYLDLLFFFFLKNNLCLYFIVIDYETNDEVRSTNHWICTTRYEQTNNFQSKPSGDSTEG